MVEAEIEGAADVVSGRIGTFVAWWRLRGGKMNKEKENISNTVFIRSRIPVLLVWTTAKS